MKRKPLRIVAGCAGLALLLLVCGLVGVFLDDDEPLMAVPDLDDDRATAEAFLAEAGATTPPVVLSPQGRLPRALDAALGESNRDANGGRKLTAVDFFDDEGAVGVTWALDDHFTPGMALSLGKQDATAILQTLEQSDVRFRTATLAGTFTLRDADGRVTETVVVQATYDHDALRVVDWATFDAATVFRAPLAHGVYLHPEVAE